MALYGRSRECQWPLDRGAFALGPQGGRQARLPLPAAFPRPNAPLADLQSGMLDGESTLRSRVGFRLHPDGCHGALRRRGHEWGQPHTLSWRAALAADAEWMVGKSRARLAHDLDGGFLMDGTPSVIEKAQQKKENRIRRLRRFSQIQIPRICVSC